MDIFWRLLFGHLLADFTLQANFINRWKRSSLFGMLVHCALHPLCYVLLTWGSLSAYWVDTSALRMNGWLCVLLLFAAHFIEDEWRVMTIFKYKTPDNTLYFIWDQIIHVAVIFAIVPLGLIGSGQPWLPEKWPVLGCLAVLVTHTATVGMYFLEKDLHGGSFPGGDEKYLGMVERLVLALTFLMPGHAWLGLAPLWLGFMYMLRSRRWLDLSWFSFGFGSIVGGVCGLAARWVYYGFAGS
ncbi:MAG: DUF3307 domain-containing protein [Elusimicrobiota bacterium]|jgi:hypothetical protein